MGISSDMRAAFRLLGSVGFWSAGASAIAIAAAAPAFAQAADPTASAAPAADAPLSGSNDAADAAPVSPIAAEDSAAEPIVVTGIRQSLATAQSIKRGSDTVVDAITAEDIGALPDRSVNEALQRVPGVAISRFAAPNDSQHFSVEGSGVVIRGLNYVRGEFNGRDTFAASSGREIGFNDVPTELVGSVEVFKNLTADLIEGGIAGTVSINARKPFDQKGQLVYLSADMNWGDMEKRGAPSFVGLFSRQFHLANGSRFGLLVSGSYSQQRSRSDSVFLGSMLPRFNGTRVLNPGTPYESTLTDSFPVPSGFDTVYAPVSGGMRTQDFNRKRIGISAAAQYENASRNLLVTAQYLRTDARERWFEHTVEPNVWYSDVNATFPAAGTSYSFDEDGVFTGGTITHTRGTVYGNVPGGCGNGGTWCPLTNFIDNGIFTTLSNRAFYQKSVTQDHALNVKWEPTDRLRFNLDGQYVRSNATNVDDIVDTATYAQTSIDLTRDIPRIQFVTPGRDVAAYFADPNNIYFRDAFNNRAINDGTEWAFRGDAAYDLSDAGFFRQLRVGGRWSDRKQTVRTNDYNNWGAPSETWTSNGPVYMADELGSTALYGFGDFFRGQANQPPSAYFIRREVMRDHGVLMDLLRDATVKGGGNYLPIEDRECATIKGYFCSNEIYHNEEKTLAAYARLDFGTDLGRMKLSGNIGVRYVRTRDSSVGALTFPTGNQVFNQSAPTDPATGLPAYTNVAGYCSYTAAHAQPGDTTPVICTLNPAQQAAVIAFANGASIPDVADQKYGNWLPSLNLKLQVTDNFLMRFAASKALSRPNFGSLRNYAGVGVSAANSAGNFGFSARAQNPYLRPVEATQFDLTAEWYFAKVGSLTGALFYKDLSHIILENSGFTRTLTNNGQTFDVDFTGPANVGGHGKIKGAEIAYQQTYDFLPGKLRGLGVQATFTYVDASHIPNSPPDFRGGNADGNQPPLDVSGINSTLPLAGLSKYNANAALFYDLDGFYARLAYSWRSKFLLTNRDCCFPFLPVYSLASGQMDASLFYTVDKHFKIGVEAQNLLDTTTKTTFVLNKEGQEAPRSFFKSDRQFVITARMTF